MRTPLVISRGFRVAIHFVILCCLLATWPAFAKDKEKPPTDAELAAISARGKLLARYDEIAWHATDAVEALHPPKGAVHGYVVDLRHDNWVCVFGALNDDKTALNIAYETVSAVEPEIDHQRAFTANQSDSGDLYREFLTMDTARSAFGPHTQAYNDAVLPAPGGGFYVYFYPGSTDNNIILMGGDVRYLVSADGKTVLETRKLHASIRQDEVHPKGMQTVEMAFHTHVLSDVPEDTDVMYVLMRRPPVPELITSERFTYEIEVNGDIKFLGDSKKFLKNLKSK